MLMKNRNNKYLSKLNEKEGEIIQIHKKYEDFLSEHPSMQGIDNQKLHKQIKEVFNEYCIIPEDPEEEFYEFTLEIQYLQHKIPFFIEHTCRKFKDLIEIAGKFFFLTKEIVYFKDHHENLLMGDMDIRKTLFCDYLPYLKGYVPILSIVLLNNHTFEELVEIGKKELQVNMYKADPDSSYRQFLYDDSELMSKDSDLEISTKRKINLSPLRKQKNQTRFIANYTKEFERKKSVLSKEEFRAKLKKKFTFFIKLAINGLFFFLVFFFQVSERPNNILLNYE